MHCFFTELVWDASQMQFHGSILRDIVKKKNGNHSGLQDIVDFSVEKKETSKTLMPELANLKKVYQKCHFHPFVE